MPKLCTKCKKVKRLSDFYCLDKMADGHLNQCKVCVIKRVKKHRRENPSVQAYDRERAKRPERKRAAREVTIRWRKQHPDGYRAQIVVGNALRDGKIKKGRCAVCGKTRWLHAHHPNYGEPLKVVWLCAMHHHRGHADGTLP